MKKSEIIVKKILEDIEDRSGLDNEWDAIDEEIKLSIIETWVNIIEKVIKEK